jgi:APA family basic amino acid/polyamine antiporter
VIARSLPSGPAILTVWIVSGVLSYFGAQAYAELGAMMPATGGQYVYLREAYGPWCAFLCGWVFVLAVVPGGIAFLAMAALCLTALPACIAPVRWPLATLPYGWA